MPITLAEAKLQLRVETDDFDALIQRYIDAAAAHVERYTGQLLTRRQITFAFDNFAPDGLELPAWPNPADVAVSYRAPDGTTHSVSSPRLMAKRYRPRVLPPIGVSWPATDANPEAVTVTVTAGFAAGEVAPDLVVAVLMLVSHWFRNREGVNVGNIVSELPLGVQALLGPHRTEIL